MADKHRIWKYLLSVMVLVVLAGVQPVTAQDKVLARVGTEIITDGDLQEMVKIFPDKIYQTPEGQQKALDYLVNIYTLAAEAQAQGLDKDQEVQRFLKFNKQDLLARIYLDKMTKDLPEPTDKEVQEFYEKNRAEFTIPESILLHHILVKTDKEAQEALTRIKKGEKFADVAVQVSICPSKVKGGNLDWLPKGTLVKEIEDAAFAMQKGQTTGPVQSKFGYHVLFLEDKRPPQESPFDETKPQIVERLKFNARQAKYEKLAADLRTKFKVETSAPAEPVAPKPAGPTAGPKN